MRHRVILLAVATAFALLPGVASAEPPTVTSMLPTSGDAAGGNLVVISGTGFQAGAIVRFGAALSTNVTVAGTTAIIATVPPGTAGSTQTVLITNPDGSTVAVGTPFTYNAAPVSALTVTGISPSTGAAGGGTLVTISGTGFLAGATVYFGNTPGTNVSVTDSTLLSVIAPAGTLGASVPVSVSNSNGFTTLAPGTYTFGSAAGSTTTGTQPTISAISPASGTAAGGTQVTLIGSGFVSGITVAFGGIPATNVTVVNSTQVTLTTPSGTVGAVPVQVTNPNGAFGGLASAFTYLVATPELTAVAPSEGLIVGGTPITLTGSGFVVGATVTIGGQPARNVAVTSPTTITAVTPPGVPGGSMVLVTNPGGRITGLATGFTYSATPSVTSTLAVTGVSPAAGPMSGGTLVTIAGQGFAAGAIVTIGGVPATNVTVLSPTQILASTPASTVSGPATVVVTVNNYGNALSGGFTYNSTGTTGGTTTTPPPQSTGLAPGTSGLFVFRGGSNADLTVASGCPAARVVLWATDARGQWVGYIPTAPAVINVSWDALFPSGIPANTPIYVRCS